MYEEEEEEEGKNIFLNKTTFHYILKIHIKIEKKKHYPVCMTSYKIYILHFSRPPKIYLTDTIHAVSH